MAGDLGRVGVALSSSYFGFFGHTGFMQAVFAAGIEPIAISGASAGAMTAAFAGVDGGLERFIDLISGLKRRDFWDPGVARTGPFGLLKGARFRQLLEDHLPVTTFEACQRPIITVSTNLARRTRHVDTTGPLAEAVLASCALPLMFHAVMRDGEPHVDGGLLDKVPVRALIERHEIDTLLVHLLPSASLHKPFPRRPFGFLNAALDLARQDNFEQQVAWAEAKGVRVVVIEQHLTRLGPFRLQHGPGVIAAAREGGAQALRDL
jgi:NTE family protein